MNCFALALILGQSTISPQMVPTQTPLVMKDPTFEKNFFLLSRLANQKATDQAISKSPVLSKFAVDFKKTLKSVYDSTASMDQSRMAELMISDADIAAIASEFKSIYQKSSTVRTLVETDLRKSGMYYRYQTQSGADLLASAWIDCANGLNYIVRVYGLGRNGRSPEIDGISYDIKSPLFGALLHNVLGVVIEDQKPSDSFFSDATRLSLRLLEINRRDEPARFEPMERGENKAAFQAIKSINFKKFKYSSILVPGYGPEEAGVSLSPIGKLALGLAVDRYRKGMAPFIIVSGGFVHPKQTPFCEAFEMKKSLMRDFGVPEKAIIIEPHARHTTTNLRNAARLIYRYGIPFEMPVLVTTNTYQSRDISSGAFKDRCQRIFGYQPHKVGERLSAFDLAIYPLIDSLYADPQDPLDP